jgi:hypothetical protein
MLTEFVEAARRFTIAEAAFYSRDQKILRGRRIVFEDVRPDLRVEHVGFTNSKLATLHRLYFHEESRAAALDMWAEQMRAGGYGSVSFHTYAHYKKTSGRSGEQGPCIQCVTLTLLKSGRTAVDVSYRSVEFYKKFGADLIFVRDHLLPDFKADIESITFRFSNVTVHPMYWAAIAPLLDDPIEELERVRKRDEDFHRKIMKRTASYVLDEYFSAIKKHAQSLRVMKDLRERLDKGVLIDLKKYIRRHVA